jgi:signal transduction histidine kinase
MIFGDEEKEHLPLSISDDGCGFSTRGTTGGRGLESMSSRAEELGAEIRIEHLDLGTRVDLSIPLSR